MAFIEIDDKKQLVSMNKLSLTLTDEEYEQYPEAREYNVCITETRMIVNYRGIISIHEKLEGLLCEVVISERDDLHIITNCINSMLTNIDGEYVMNKIGRYYEKRDRSNEYMYYPMWIIYDTEKDCYINKSTHTILTHHALNRYVDHLYNDQKFYKSAYRDIDGNLVLTDKKIIKCIKYQDHLLVKYDDDESNYIILLCYSYAYDVKCDIPFPSIMTKSARKL